MRHVFRFWFSGLLVLVLLLPAGCFAMPQTSCCAGFKNAAACHDTSAQSPCCTVQQAEKKVLSFGPEFFHWGDSLALSPQWFNFSSLNFDTTVDYQSIQQQVAVIDDSKRYLRLRHLLN